MMGIQPEQADRLTWRKYQGLLWNWNDRHSTEEDAPTADPAMIEYMKRQDEMIERRGWGRSLH